MTTLADVNFDRTNIKENGHVKDELEYFESCTRLWIPITSQPNSKDLGNLILFVMNFVFLIQV